MGAIGADVALPSAVSEAGGLGMIGAAGMPAEDLEGLLGVISSATTKPIGVNFLIPFLSNDVVEIAAKHASVVEFFYGEPDAGLVERVHEHRALAAWQVGSADEAAAAVHAGCDFVVVQGTEAGGHVRGDASLADVLGVVAEGITVPLVAGGGITTARDVTAALESGASAVRVGTRFVAASESIAHPQYIAALIKATAADTVLTRTFTRGWDAPHRVLRACVDAVEDIEDDFVATLVSPGGDWPVPRLSTMPPTKDVHGNVAAMCMYAGTSVDGVSKRMHAAEIVAELMNGI